ncbi:MAG: GntR family transcriptional regulator [Steroidobacteraceae bacterium]|nr:GntR family transcriptional regulator [Steroidobacteraceae bacterium]
MGARRRRSTGRAAPRDELGSAIAAGLRSPKYAQLYNSLRAWILEGRYPPGSQLPTEQSLATRLGVSRNTARQAIQMLVNERLVSRQAGRGTFVLQDVDAAPVRSDLDQLMRKVRRLSAGSRQRYARVEEIAADEVTRRDLLLEPGARVLRASHVRVADNVPVGYVETTVPLDVARAIDGNELNRSPMFTLLNRKGMNIVGADQFIGATLADIKLAALLETEVGAPIVSVRLLVVDDRNRRVERVQQWYRADRYTHHAYLGRTGR